MEKDRNPFPEIDLLPRITRAANFIKRVLSPRPTEAPDFMSNHYRGAAAMLDESLYDQIQVEGFLYDGEDQLRFDL